MVGVTGSAGKTTTCWLVRSIFEELGQITGMLGESEFVGLRRDLLPPSLLEMTVNLISLPFAGRVTVARNQVLWQDFL